MSKNPSEHLLKMRQLLLADPLHKVVESHHEKESQLLTFVRTVESNGVLQMEKQSLAHKKDTDKLRHTFEQRMDGLEKSLDHKLNTAQETFFDTTSRMEEAWQRERQELKQMLNTEVQRLFEMKQVLNIEVQRLLGIEQRLDAKIQHQARNQEGRLSDLQAEMREAVDLLQKKQTKNIKKTAKYFKKLKKHKKKLYIDLIVKKTGRQVLLELQKALDRDGTS